jgi:hypothetical protein
MIRKRDIRSKIKYLKREISLTSNIENLENLNIQLNYYEEILIILENLY